MLRFSTTTTQTVDCWRGMLFFCSFVIPSHTFLSNTVSMLGWHERALQNALFAFDWKKTPYFLLHLFFYSNFGTANGERTKWGLEFVPTRKRIEVKRMCIFCTRFCPADLVGLHTRKRATQSVVKFAGEINVNVHELLWLLKYWNSAMATQFFFTFSVTRRSSRPHWDWIVSSSI